MVANNPLCGQLKRENEISPSQFAPERLVLRELCPFILLRPVSPLIVPHTQAKYGGHWNEIILSSFRYGFRLNLVKSRVNKCAIFYVHSAKNRRGSVLLTSAIYSITIIYIFKIFQSPVKECLKNSLWQSKEENTHVLVIRACNSVGILLLH